MADSNPLVASGDEGTNAWERPWSIDEIKKSANDWSLAGDAGMLQYLQNFSQRIISRTHDMQEQMNGLLHESKLAEVRVQNAFNDFIMLANTQFVENRVYDEDVNAGVNDTSDKKEEKEKTREEREAELIPKITSAMQLGLNVIDTAFDKLDVNEVNSDSEEDDESPYKAEPILEPKDPYLTRPLPYLIGSQAFMTDDDVGLRDVASDAEESDAGIISESESESESEPEIQPKPSAKQSVLDSEESGSEYESDEELFDGKDSNSDSDESILSEEEEQKSIVQPTDFAAELAAKMGGAPPPQPVKKEKSQESKKERSGSKSKPKPKPEPDEDDDLFGPPPMDDEDSPFGKKGGLFSTGGGLFDDDDENQGGLFDDIIAEKPKPAKEQKAPPQPAPRSDSEEDSESEEPPPKLQEQPSRSRTKSGKPIPTGGVSIFGGGDDDLFGSKKEDSDIETPKPKAETKKPASTTNAAIGLFDDDDDDLFAVPVSKEPKQQARKPAASLFDNEEEEDLFATAAPAVKKEVKPHTKPEPFKPEKKLPAGAVSMFGGNVNPLAAAIKSQRQPSEDEESDEGWEEEDEEDLVSETTSQSGQIKPPIPAVTAAKKERSPSVSSNSLFAEEPEDDLFASKPKAAPPAKVLSKAKAPPVGSSKGLFGDEEDEDDLFATTPKPKPAQSEKKAKAKAGSLFLGEEEDDGDLFDTAVTKPSKPSEAPAKKKPAGGVALFNDDLFSDVKAKHQEKETPKPKVEEQKEEPPRPRNNTLSLFDDNPTDGQEILGSSEPKPKAPAAKPPQTLETQNQSNKPRTRSLFADDDVLFGGAEEDPAVDLFGASSPLSPKEESKPFAPNPEPVNEPVRPATLKDKVEVKGATISASSTDLFTGDDDPDMFNRSPLGDSLTTEKADPKVEVKGATVSESSTDKSSKPPDPVKRKPIGGVSMFGGMDPTAMLKKRSGSKINDSLDDAGPPPIADNPPKGLDSTDSAFSTKSPNDAPKKPSTTPRPGGPPRSTSIGKLQANLAINPSALLPGAAPRVKDDGPTPVGFDAPVKAQTLHTVQKDRVRGQNKRRPPTRKPRGAATSPSGSDFMDSTEVSSSPPLTNGPLHVNPVSQTRVSDPRPKQGANSSLSTPTPAVASKGIFEEEDKGGDLDFASKSGVEPTVSGVRPPMRHKSENTDDIFTDSTSTNSTSPSNAASVPKSMSDIFSEAFSKSSASKTKPPEDSQDDLFANAAPPPRKPQEKKVIVDITDDLFGDTMPSNDSKDKSSMSSNQASAFNDDIFASPTKQTPSSRPVEFAPSRSPPPLEDSPDDIFSDSTYLPKKSSGIGLPEEDDDDDIFGSSTVKAAKPPVTDVDDIFAPSSTSTSNSVSKEPAIENDEDDLFAAKPLKKKPKTTTKDEALFEDNTDIFSDLPSTKTKEKKPKIKSATNEKSIFKDDIDDIFADSGVKTKSKKTSSKKTANKTDIFSDGQEGENIFDDPLNALTH